MFRLRELNLVGYRQVELAGDFDAYLVNQQARLLRQV